MARVKFGPLVSSVNGAVGGVVFRGAGNNASVSPFTLPPRSRSENQARNSSAMELAFKAWRTIDRPARLAWYWYAVTLRTGRRFTQGEEPAARAAFVSWASAHALVGTLPPIAWPLYPLIDPPGFLPVFVWDAAPASTGSSFIFIDELAPSGAAVWLSPINPSTGRPRGRRVLVWNTGRDGGTWSQSVIGPPYAWTLDIGTAAWDRFAGFPTGTWFDVESVTIRDDGAIFRQSPARVEKTTS